MGSKDLTKKHYKDDKGNYYTITQLCQDDALHPSSEHFPPLSWTDSGEGIGNGF